MDLRKSLRFFGKHYELLTLSLPAVIYIFIVSYIPMFGVVIAFKNYKYDEGILGSEWIGFKNFEFLFKSKDVSLIFPIR
jgi:putative aldouronate transport system permease protein